MDHLLFSITIPLLSGAKLYKFLIFLYTETLEGI